jgi:hypothetical protein
LSIKPIYAAFILALLPRTITQKRLPSAKRMATIFCLHLPPAEAPFSRFLVFRSAALPMVWWAPTTCPRVKAFYDAVLVKLQIGVVNEQPDAVFIGALFRSFGCMLHKTVQIPFCFSI